MALLQIKSPKKDHPRTAIFLRTCGSGPEALKEINSYRRGPLCSTQKNGCTIYSCVSKQSTGERHYSTKRFLKKVISTLSCCLKPAADVTADQTEELELSALQAMTRQVEVEVDTTPELAEGATSQPITVYHTGTGEASTSQALPTKRQKLSLFHSVMRQQITGPCEQQKDSFIIAELAKRFIPAGPRFSLCSEYLRIIGLREKCEKGFLPTEAEFAFLSLWPSVNWYGWLYRETQKPKTGADFEEIRFCLNKIRDISHESLYSCVFLHPLLECLVKESSKRAFSFEPTFEKACEVLHTREILSPTQERYHASRFRDLLDSMAYWEKRIMATALHIDAFMLKHEIGLEPEPLRRPPFGKAGVFLHRLMEAQERIPLSQERLLITSVFEPMTLEGILVVIGGFLTFAVAIFFLLRWLCRWPIRTPVILLKHEVTAGVPITKQARSNFVGIFDSNLEVKVEELREPRIVWPENWPRKPGNGLTSNVRGGLGIPRPPPPR